MCCATLLQDLFERSGYEDDGIYDWDIAKKQSDKQAGGDQEPLGPEPESAKTGNPNTAPW